MKAPKVKNQKDKKPRDVRGFVRRALYWGAVAGVWGAVALAFYVVWLAQSLPNLRTLPRPGLENRIEMRTTDGKILATYGAIYGKWIKFEDIPPVMVKALVAVEDRRFYQHGAIDVRGIARAVLSNIVSSGRSRGASTLTQQLAKNLFLTHERTIDRKIKELLLAVWLERSFTKDEIIELYLNRVYFGGGAYGLDAGTRRYFGHSGKKISKGEAAMLAGLFKAPSSYAPTSHYDRAIERMDVVLDVLVREAVVTDEEAAKIRKTPPRTESAVIGGNARYFTDWVLDQVASLIALGTDPIVVYTTVDARMQRAAHNSIKLEVARYDVLQGALVAMKGDGAIKAMVGGADYDKSQFNRTAQARRQPGSSYKLFVYLEALKAGMKPEDHIVDEPVDVGGWRPQNANGEYEGEVTLRRAFYRSLNTVAVKLSEQVGRDRVRQLAIDMGVETPMHPHPSLALGTTEVTPMDMTRAYAVVQNGGFFVEPYGILEIRTARGELLYRHKPKASRRVLDENIVRNMTNMLQDVVRVGSGMAAAIDRPAAGKTGTTQDNRDAWFLGFTSDLIAGVWVGKDNAAPMKGISGGNLPARLWGDFMRQAHTGRPARPLLYDIMPADDTQLVEEEELGDEHVVQPVDHPVTHPASEPAPTADPAAKKKRSFLDRLLGLKKELDDGTR